MLRRHLIYAVLTTRMKPKTWLVAAALALCVPAANAETREYVSSDVPKTISAGNPSTTFSDLQVPDAFIIESLTLQLTMSHDWDTDLDLFLIGPTGLTVELSTDNGGSGNHYANTIFDDAALTSIVDGMPPFSGSYRPEQPLATFANTSAPGSWRLQVTDDNFTNGGTLHAWNLTFTTAAIPIPEPHSYALMLAGLGLLGFAARRRQRASR
jgi:subtilisin-like proprotein convertase family protein